MDFRFLPLFFFMRFTYLLTTVNSTIFAQNSAGKKSMLVLVSIISPSEETV